MKDSSYLLALGLAALVVVVPGQLGASDAQPSGGADVAELLAQLRDINRTEIEFGNLAIIKGFSPNVREYGERIAMDHARMERKVDALSRTLGVPPSPTALGVGRSQPKRERLIAAIRDDLDFAAGKRFDRTFAQAMVAAHDAAIQTLNETRPKVENRKACALLDEVLAQLEMHRDAARSLR